MIDATDHPLIDYRSNRSSICGRTKLDGSSSSAGRHSLLIGFL